MSNGRILVVDDEADIRTLLAEVLEGEGYSVATAANGMEALQSLRSSSPPCVILLDLMMPVMDGYGFCAERERDPDLAALPVIVITAGSDVRRTDLHARAILGKPLQLPRLMDEIRQCCGDTS